MCPPWAASTSSRPQSWNVVKVFANHQLLGLCSLATQFSVTINMLLKCSPNSTINGFDIRFGWRPHVWFSEISVFFLQKSSVRPIYCTLRSDGNGNFVSLTKASINSVVVVYRTLMLPSHDGHSEHVAWNYVQLFAQLCVAVKQHVVYSTITERRVFSLFWTILCSWDAWICGWPIQVFVKNNVNTNNNILAVKYCR